MTKKYTTAYSPTLRDALEKFRFLNGLSGRQIRRAFGKLLYIKKAGYDVQLHDPQKIIISNEGIKFLVQEENQSKEKLNTTEALLLLFRHLVGTHINKDKVTAEETMYRNFLELDENSDDRTKALYCRCQVRMFYRVVGELLTIASLSPSVDQEMLRASLRSTEYNYILELKDNIEGTVTLDSFIE